MARALNVNSPNQLLSNWDQNGYLAGRNMMWNQFHKLVQSEVESTHMAIFQMSASTYNLYEVDLLVDGTYANQSTVDGAPVSSYISDLKSIPMNSRATLVSDEDLTTILALWDITPV